MRPPLPQVRFSIIRQLLASQAGGGYVLMLAAAAAMVVASNWRMMLNRTWGRGGRMPLMC